MNKDNINEFLNAAQKADNSKLRKMGESAAASLSAEQREAINKALSDRDFLDSLLSSQIAQDLIKKIKGEK